MTGCLIKLKIYSTLGIVVTFFTSNLYLWVIRTKICTDEMIGSLAFASTSSGVGWRVVGIHANPPFVLHVPAADAPHLLVT